MKILHGFINGILLFFSIMFLAIALDFIPLAIVALIIAILTIYLTITNKKIKPKVLYKITLSVLIICFSIGIPNLNNQSTNIDSASKKSESTANSTSLKDNNKQENTESDTSVTNKDTNSNDSSSKTSTASIHFINTGNSDAILILQGEKVVLIDGGDNDDEGMLTNYLKKQGVKNITYMIATHAHADHIGGLDAIIKNFTVENLLVSNGSAETQTYRDFINAAANKGLAPSVPLENAEFKLSDSSYIKIFNSNGGSSTNEESLVTLFVNGEDKALFTGDAEKETEHEILDRLDKVNLLKVGHHGSRSSTSSEFLNVLKPEYAVITVGKDNKYNHPHSDTMNKLKNANIEVHRTDECDSVIFTSTGSGMKTDCAIGTYSFRDNKSSTTNDTSTSQSNSKPSITTPKPESSNTNSTSSTSKIVYWTPNGKSYHSRKNCSTLSRSKVINEGTLEESNKSDPCDVCN